MTHLFSEKPELFKGRHFNHLPIIQAVRWLRHLQTELSRRVRSDGGARRHSRTYHLFAMGPTLRSRLREKMEELRAPCRLILESR